MTKGVNRIANATATPPETSSPSTSSALGGRVTGCESADPRLGVRPEPRRQRVASLNGIIEGQPCPGNLLIRLVSLSGDHDHITVPSIVERPPNGDMSVRTNDDLRVSGVLWYA